MTKAKVNLYRTVDDRVVLEGDPDAAFVLAVVGQEIPPGYDAKDVNVTADEHVELDGKAAAKPVDKAVKAPANKSKG